MGYKTYYIYLFINSFSGPSISNEEFGGFGVWSGTAAVFGLKRCGTYFPVLNLNKYTNISYKIIEI